MLCQAMASNHNLFHPQTIKRSPISGDYIRSSDSIQPFLARFSLPICSSFFGRENLRDFVEAASINCHEAFELNSTREKKHLDGIWNTPFVLFSAYPGNIGQSYPLLPKLPSPKARGYILKTCQDYSLKGN